MINASRRAVLGGVAATAVAASTSSLGASPVTGKIDTHHHFMPPEFVNTIGAERLASVTPQHRLPDWSVQRALDVCGMFGISEAILSISPGYPALSPAVERPLMRVCNDAGARIRHDNPGKFGQFASIPMFDRGEALKEIDYAFGTLKADGVIVSTNYDGTYPGDPSFDEVWQELNRRKAVVFVHPTTPPYTLKGQPPLSVGEFPHDTTRAAISLIYSGATQRYRDIKFILSHAGGTLPFLAPRIAGGVIFDPKLHERIPDPMGEIRKFWYDTAISGHPASLSALMVIADPGRITFGSDFPYAPPAGIKINGDWQDGFLAKNPHHADIDHGNAARLLGRAA